jgi:5-(carboxyamino)imidazole ribonucleotide synthase
MRWLNARATNSLSEVMRMLAPGSVIGILGGGQLARMMALAAAPLGFKIHIYAPEADCPAADCAQSWTRADYDDLDALDAFAKSVSAVTYEFENVPVDAAQRLGQRVSVFPDPRALGVSQDRVIEKEFLNGIGIKTAPFVPINAGADLSAGLRQLGTPAILKTRRLGYDGKGQAMVRSVVDAVQAFDAIGAVPCILEGFIGFDREISTIAARDQNGVCRFYDPSWNEHKHHILHTSTVPCGLDKSLIDQAGKIGIQILDALNYVGVLGVEFFVTPNGLLVNEIAPRVHNSGHWTMDACAVSQFEQHIRCVAGWPLGPVTRDFDAVMENLIGDDVNAWASLAADPAARLHLYGKAEIKPGRKMGHVNRLYARRDPP